VNAKHAREIRKGILAARERPLLPNVLVILNSRYYSRLAVYAFNETRRRAFRHYRPRWVIGHNI